MMFLAALTLTLQLADARQTLGPHGVGRTVITTATSTIVTTTPEANLAPRGLVRHPAALYAAKLGTGALVLYGAHALRQRGHPRAAFWYLVAINAAQGAVVVHNMRVHR